MELLLAQGAGGSILPSKRLELGDEGGDGGFHGAEKERSVKRRDVRRWEAAQGLTWWVGVEQVLREGSRRTERRGFTHTHIYRRFVAAPPCTDQRKTGRAAAVSPIQLCDRPAEHQKTHTQQSKRSPSVL